jgi:hypothetical protein
MTGLLSSFGSLLVLLAVGVAWMMDDGAQDQEPATDPSEIVQDVQTPPPEAPSPTPEPTPTPASAPAPPPAPAPVNNRLDCNAIRGTDYLSLDERNWFLTNCLR